MQREVLIHNGWEFWEPRSRRWFPADVPGCIHLDLLRHDLIPDPFWADNEHKLGWIENSEWLYRLRFTTPQELAEFENIDLIADGLDTLATITLNGHELGFAENMFVRYRFPVRERLRRGRHELTIRFHPPLPYIRKHLPKGHFKEWNDPVGGCSVIRKEQCSFGWDWGPRFPTCGIYRPIRLHAWTGNRIESVRIEQVHTADSVSLLMKPELAWRGKGARFHSRLFFNGELVAENDGLRLDVQHPQLWWPHQFGPQNLYELEVELRHRDNSVDVWRRRIGLRTIELQRVPDIWGQTFRFAINGKPIFAKGANWIPAHSFVAAIQPSDYDYLLTSAQAANMNMIRVWGGGIYEPDVFYDLCDEKGLLVWQDFMFACALYPAGEHFCELVRAEAAYQVQRLAHHASLALWCGNNEIEMMPQEIKKTRQRELNYRKLFYRLLPSVVKRYDAATEYLPSSPHNPEGHARTIGSEQGVDAHFWAVWVDRVPVTHYARTQFRFVSEFGMQSLSSPEVVRMFSPPDKMNPMSPVMESHQKCKQGNLLVLDYVFRRYQFPKDYASLAYIAELNQAHCLKFAVEHFRRSMPQNMGALYWQLNDCWPGFSWSGIEFNGRWKALHYYARRFFAPALVSAWVPGQEVFENRHWRPAPPSAVELFVICDGPEPLLATLRWRAIHIQLGLIEEGSQPVVVQPGQSRMLKRLHYDDAFHTHGADKVLLRVWIEQGGKWLSEDTVLFVPPSYLPLGNAPIRRTIKRTGEQNYRVTLVSRDYHHQVALSLRSGHGRFSDNFFDLFPGEKIAVDIETPRRIDRAKFASELELRSLVHTYTPVRPR